MALFTPLLANELCVAHRDAISRRHSPCFGSWEIESIWNWVPVLSEVYFGKPRHRVREDSRLEEYGRLTCILLQCTVKEGREEAYLSLEIIDPSKGYHQMHIRIYMSGRSPDYTKRRIRRKRAQLTAER